MKKLLLLFILIPFLNFGQVQIGQDINGEQGGAFNDFGSSVSSSSNGNIVAIGSPLTNANGVKSGQVGIYESISGVWSQIGSYINGEAAENEFGHSVSLSSDGNIVAIGAIGNDDNGINSGHVRVFENIGGVWTQVGNDIDGEAAEDESGFSVSLSSDGTIVAIGATRNDGNGTNTGHVRIYENVGGTWTQVGNDIDGESEGDQSGFSVSLSANGSIVAIGAPINDGNGILSGHVRIYENVSGSWTQIGNDIDGEEMRDRSGSSVSLSSDGSTVAIGASRNDANGFSSGHVRVYENMGDVWTQIGNDIDGESSLEYFGESLSLSSDGTILAIGSIQGSNNNGYVRIYENIGGAWSLIGNVIEGETVENQSGRYLTLGSGFNVSLSSDGSKVAIGATENDGNGYNSGHVRIYENINGFWTQVGNDIDGERTYSPDQLGYSTSISSDGNVIAIASNNKDNGIDNIQAGQVVIYENLGGVWNQVGNKINGEASFDYSGDGLSLSSDGGIVAIGAARNDGNGFGSGHVRVFENVGGIWTQIGDDIDGESSSDSSGQDVSLSSDGSIVAIGAPANDGNEENSGHVRIYENVGGIWIQIGNDIDGEGLFHQSGGDISLSADGTIVAIGSIFSLNNNGYVHIYKNIGGVWTQVGNNIEEEILGGQFGFSVSLSSDGSIVAIGVRESNGSNPQLTSIYENINGVWAQIGNDIEGQIIGTSSGGDVSLSPDGSIVAIGYPLNDGIVNQSGQVIMYKNINGSWIQVGDIINGEAMDDQFGFSLALSGNSKLVVGSFKNDTNGYNAGQVRVFSFASELAIIEVVEDITGNNNGINVTAEQLNRITGVSGAVEGVDYTTALGNGIFEDENNPTASEIQEIIDQVNATLGLEKIEDPSFKIFPNPAKDQFTIQLDKLSNLQNVSIYNNIGQLILTSKETTIDSSKLTSGLYVVELETNRGKSAKKLIIE